MRCPEHIASFAHAFYPRLTCVAQPAYELGFKGRRLTDWQDSKQTPRQARTLGTGFRAQNARVHTGVRRHAQMILPIVFFFRGPGRPGIRGPILRWNIANVSQSEPSIRRQHGFHAIYVP
jgi:hypothetical protein